MITCQELTELVTDYVEKNMSLVDRMRFQMHVGMCKSCRAYLKQMRATVDVLGSMPLDTNIPTDVKSELLSRFQDWKKEECVGLADESANGET